jgi:hypothetical protein
MTVSLRKIMGLPRTTKLIKDIWLESSWDSDYAKLFFFGKKSDTMIEIEKEWNESIIPGDKTDDFGRLQAFFNMFNLTLHFSRGWIMFLPARHTFEYHKDNIAQNLSCVLFALYLTDKMARYPKDVRSIID